MRASLRESPSLDRFLTALPAFAISARGGGQICDPASGASTDRLVQLWKRWGASHQIAIRILSPRIDSKLLDELLGVKATVLDEANLDARMTQTITSQKIY